MAHQLRTTPRGAPVAEPASLPPPTIQEPLATPRLPGEPQPPQPVLSSAAATAQPPAAEPCAARAPASGAPVAPQPVALSAAPPRARERCAVLSDGSLGPVTGAIEGRADKVQGKVPSQAGGGSARSDSLLASDSCLSEVALETVVSVAAPAESIMQRTSFVLNTELAAAQTQGCGYVAGDITAAGPDGSDSGRIVVEDRVGVVSCHDSGTGALNRAAAAAAGVTWTGPPAVTAFGRGGARGVDASAGSSSAVLPPSGREAFEAAPPAVVALGGDVSRKERSARLSAALPARLSLGPVSSVTTAGGTERLQSVLARRRQSKMLRRQSSSGTVSGSSDVVQRTKSRRVRPFASTQVSAYLVVCTIRVASSPGSCFWCCAQCMVGVHCIIQPCH